MTKGRAAVAVFLASLFWPPVLTAAEAEETSPQEKPDIYVGAGVVLRSKPFEGVDAKVYPVPLFGYEGKRLYLRGIMGGYRLIQFKGWWIGPTVRPRFDGYEASDSSALRGMKNRNATVDGGVEIAKRTRWGLLSAVFVTDLLRAHDGYELELSYTAMVSRWGFDFIPGLAVRWQNDNLINYYYGVKDSEVAAGRPAYEPDATITPLARLAVRRELSKRWGLLLATQYEWLGSEIGDSPIVDDNGVASVLLGATYTF